MVGVCGSIDKKYNLKGMSDFFKVIGDEKTEWYRDNLIDIGLVKHKGEKKRIREIDDKIIGIFGEIYSYKEKDNYIKPPLLSDDIHRFILDKYEKLKDNLFLRLNGNFLLFIIDLKKEELKIISDRLGTNPLFIYKNKKDLIFTSKIQSLAELDIDLQFDRDYLYEYFVFERVFGTKTPLKKVRKLPPSSFININLKTNEITKKQYWIPEYNPSDKPFDFFVDKLYEKLKDAIKERLNNDLDYGLMLSGGFDSRLILAILDDIGQEVSCYHMNEYMNQEAQIAEKVASKSENDFVFLKREKDSPLKKLKLNSKFNNFYGCFDLHRTTIFKDELKNKDVIFDGTYGDTLLNSHYIPKIDLELGFNFSIPISNFPDDQKSYIYNYASTSQYLSGCKEEPYYFYYNNSMIDVLKMNINLKSFTNHEVQYGDFETILLATEYFPITNRYTYGTLENISDIVSHGHRDPFLDNRIIDFQLHIPIRHKIRKNFVCGMLNKYHPNYAEIPNSKGYKAYDGIVKEEILSKYMALKKKLGNSPKEHTGSWTDHKKLIREGYFDDIWEKSNLKHIPFIDAEKANKMYEKVKKGETSYRHFYRLLTYIEMPILEKVSDFMKNDN